MVFAQFFVDVGLLPHDTYGFIQLITLGCVYGVVLFIASGYITRGSELLLLVPSFAGVVGSIVLPIFGAVPDAAVVLFSGLGPKEKVRQQLAIGVGALSGSSVMLLTIPWAMTIVGGRVNLSPHDTVPQYNKRPGKKLDPPGRVRSTGIGITREILYDGRFMVFTLIGYLVVQGMAFVADCGTTSGNCNADQARWAAVAAFILCVLLCIVYLNDQVRRSRKSGRHQNLREDVLRGAIMDELVSVLAFSGHEDNDDEKLLTQNQTRLKSVLRPFFDTYDTNHDGVIDASELRVLVRDLGVQVDLMQFMRMFDIDQSGTIDFEEFTSLIQQWISTQKQDIQDTRSQDSNRSRRGEEWEVQEQDEDLEGFKCPDHLLNLTPAEQQRRVLIRALGMMCLGTALAIVFADPLVGVMDELGARLHFSPFFVAFVCSPLAASGAQLRASWHYSKKQTQKSAVISLTSLLGTATINNTLVLSVFLFLIIWRGLSWTFTAETLIVLLVEGIMFWTTTLRVHKWWYAPLIFMIFPASIALVATLKAVGLN